MSKSIADTSNHHEQDTSMSTEVNQQLEPKKKIEFNRHGEAVGPNATHFKSQIGKYVKTFIPISYTAWPQVPKNYKDDVWNEIVKEFEVPYYLRSNIEKSMPNVFRKLKHYLRINHLDKHQSLEAKKLDIPLGIKKEDWEKFCVNGSSERQIEIRAKAIENRKNSLYGHTGGRKSAAMIEHDMIAKRGDHYVTRSEVWLQAHTKKDGTILPSAEPFVEKVKAKIEEHKQSEGKSSSSHLLLIDNDPLTEVFGKKSKGLPGVGSFVSKRKYDVALHPYIMYSGERGEKQILENKFDKMQVQLDFIVGCCKAQMAGGSSMSIPLPEVVDRSLDHAPSPTSSPHATKSPTQLGSPPAVGETLKPSSPMIMNTIKEQQLAKGNSLASTHVESAPVARYCELLDWNMNCVAIAKEVTDQVHKGMCHNYRLKLEYEKKVSLCVRKIYDAKLYKETHDAKIMKDVQVGDFIVWPISHIKFMEI